MAVVTVPEENKTIEKPEEIAAFLAPHGIHYERWPLEDRVDADASPDQILEAYRTELDQLKAACEFNCGCNQLEASGNITLENVAEVAETGVDYISIGSITKHIQAIDLSMRMQ